jgi:hypothetical protein
MTDRACASDTLEDTAFPVIRVALCSMNNDYPAIKTRNTITDLHHGHGKA